MHFPTNSFACKIQMTPPPPPLSRKNTLSGHETYFATTLRPPGFFCCTSRPGWLAPLRGSALATCFAICDDAAAARARTTPGSFVARRATGGLPSRGGGGERALASTEAAQHGTAGRRAHRAALRAPRWAHGFADAGALALSRGPPPRLGHGGGGLHGLTASAPCGAQAPHQYWQHAPGPGCYRGCARVLLLLLLLLVFSLFSPLERSGTIAIPRAGATEANRYNYQNKLCHGSSTNAAAIRRIGNMHGIGNR